MKQIEFERLEPDAENPCKLKYAGQRKAEDVFHELEARLDSVGYLPDEYLLLDRRWQNGREMPRDAGFFCRTDYGGSESIYLDMFLEWYEDSQRRTEHFMTGKTLGESGADMDRMSLISPYLTAADEGITGTSVEKREDFQRMMQDCRKGKIDRILAKSISRFARNTKDCLAAVRELKELGVSVLFEEQGIDTARVSSEMVTAIMASLAQKQSESISGNVQWSIQHQMEAGKYKLRTAPFGYTVRNGELTVNEAEAPIVQDIFNAYLSGANTKEICDRLNAQQGSSRKWLRREIDYILMNERYAGSAIFQKKYTRAELPRTVKRNHGERAMYYVSDSNAPIIPQNVFDRAQELRKRRTVSRSDEPKVYSGKIQCSCGSRCRAKTSNQIWYWSCVVHEEQRNACHIKQVPEETINAAFCRLYYKLKHHGNPIFTQMLSNLQKIRYSRMLWSENVISLNKKISDILSQVQFLTQLQQAGSVDPDTFITSNNKLSEQLRRLKQEKARLLDTDSDDLADRTRDLMDALEDGPDFLDGFDAELFDALVEKIIVDSNECLRFRLKNGLELTEQIERTKR